MEKKIDSKSGKEIANAIKSAIDLNVKEAIRTAPFDNNKRGVVLDITPNGYTVRIENKVYTNVPIIAQNIDIKVNDLVICNIPNNQMSQMYIVGKQDNSSGIIKTTVNVNDIPQNEINFTSEQLAILSAGDYIVEKNTLRVGTSYGTQYWDWIKLNSGLIIMSLHYIVTSTYTGFVSCSFPVVLSQTNNLSIIKSFDSSSLSTNAITLDVLYFKNITESGFQTKTVGNGWNLNIQIIGRWK